MPPNYARMSNKHYTRRVMYVFIHSFIRHAMRRLKIETMHANGRTKTCCLTSILSCSFPISLMFLSLFRFSHGKLIYFAPQSLQENCAPKTFHQFSHAVSLLHHFISCRLRLVLTFPNARYPPTHVSSASHPSCNFLLLRAHQLFIITY